MDDIRICTDMLDPMAEEPGMEDNPPESALHMVMDLDKKWKNGQLLRVKLLGGSPFVQKMVKKYAKVWLKHANLRMRFVESGNAEIRVSFNRGRGSWSFVGTDCRRIPKARPTMNFGWFNDETEEREFSRTVTHEFGHALGCEHEHQNPAGNIPWNLSKVFEYYRRQGWNEETVRRNVIEAYKSNRSRYSSFDSKSIMLYPIPPELTTNGFSTIRNYELSKGDKRFIAKMYPRPKSVAEDDGNSGSGDVTISVSISIVDDESDVDEDSDSSSLSQLDSIMNGSWRGHYYYKNGTTDGESTFELSTKLNSTGKSVVDVKGRGNDTNGSFVIKGKVSDSGEISFTKRYEDYPAKWFYSGSFDQTRRKMEGSWGDGVENLGTFSFRRK